MSDVLPWFSITDNLKLAIIQKVFSIRKPYEEQGPNTDTKRQYKINLNGEENIYVLRAFRFGYCDLETSGPFSSNSYPDQIPYIINFLKLNRWSKICSNLQIWDLNNSFVVDLVCILKPNQISYHMRKHQLDYNLFDNNIFQTVNKLKLTNFFVLQPYNYMSIETAMKHFKEIEYHYTTQEKLLEIRSVLRKWETDQVMRTRLFNFENRESLTDNQKEELKDFIQKETFWFEEQELSKKKVWLLKRQLQETDEYAMFTLSYNKAEGVFKTFSSLEEVAQHITAVVNSPIEETKDKVKEYFEKTRRDGFEQ